LELEELELDDELDDEFEPDDEGESDEDEELGGDTGTKKRSLATS
jgi:hypothetical protein